MRDSRISETITLVITVILVVWAVILLLVLSVLTHEILPSQTYLCPVDRSMVIFIDECVDEGYTVSQCYSSYVEAQCFGSVKLEMPTKET